MATDRRVNARTARPRQSLSPRQAVPVGQDRSPEPFARARLSIVSLSISVGLVVAAACAAPQSAPPEQGPSSVALTAFEDACAAGVNSGLKGQLVYPERLDLQYHESVNYNVALDVGGNPLPPDQIIDVGEGSATSERVNASCHVQAKLEAVGDHTKIDRSDDSDWVAYDFSPLGVIEWAWTVTADEPVDQSVRLRVRPAVLAGDSAVYGQNSEVVATTSISVHAEWYDRWAYHATQTAAGLTVTIGAFAGLILLLVVKGKEIGKALRLDKAASWVWHRLTARKSTSTAVADGSGPSAALDATDGGAPATPASRPNPHH